MDKKTAHNIAIWKLIATLERMRQDGFTLIDITIEDDLTIAVRGVKIIEEDDLPNLNQLIV